MYAEAELVASVQLKQQTVNDLQLTKSKLTFSMFQTLIPLFLLFLSLLYSVSFVP